MQSDDEETLALKPVSLKEQIQLIRSPAGQLEAKVSELNNSASSAWGIVCHPHPLQGGTMENKVVTTLVKTFQQLHISTVRFNFRGVGESTGEYDHGEGELDDLLTVIAWVQQDYPNRDIWLAGFSFGGYIAAKGASEIAAKRLITVAPAVEHFPMKDIPAITCPWILVQGEKDDVVAPQAVFDFAESRHPRPIVIRFANAGHFFHGQLSELRAKLVSALQRFG